MALKFKQHVSRRILETLKLSGIYPTTFNVNLPKCLYVANNKDGSNVELYLPLKPFCQSISNVASQQKVNVSDIKSLSPDEKIFSVYERGDKQKSSLVFNLNRNLFIKEVLDDMINKPYPYSKKFDVAPYPFGKTVVVEFSSPNIAKPFHIGHLRSTIIGNFIAKLYEHLSCNVIKINYLGDWGTQLGLLKVGLDMASHSPESLKQNPIQLLFEAYVNANKAASVDPKIAHQAREIFQRMEQGDSSQLQMWKEVREYTIPELEQVYKRLGVVFNEYAWESMYAVKDIQSVLDVMRDKYILHTLEDGKQAVSVGDKKIPVLKSNGSTLYLVRDIAAAMDRYETHSFDEMIYVVDNAQSDHFVSLFGVLKKMEVPWASKLRHIKFGRVRGMSTRTGNVVFLKDILDKTRDIMVMKQQNSPTTKVNLQEGSETADILGVSAIIINDLKQRRQKDYEFDWDRATQVQGETGVKLQYTHCRLWSLEKQCGAYLAHACDPTVLKEPEVTVLVQEIARNAINRAMKVLPVKGQVSHIASQRLMVFHASRLVLNQGLRILGVPPLEEM